MVAPVQNYSQSGNRSNNGMHNSASYKDRHFAIHGCGVLEDQFTDVTDAKINNPKLLLKEDRKDISVEDERLVQELNSHDAAKDCAQESRENTTDEINDDDIEIVIYLDKTMKKVCVMIVSTKIEISDIENDNHVILATSSNDRAVRRKMNVDDKQVQDNDVGSKQATEDNAVGDTQTTVELLDKEHPEKCRATVEQTKVKTNHVLPKESKECKVSHGSPCIKTAVVSVSPARRQVKSAVVSINKETNANNNENLVAPHKEVTDEKHTFHNRHADYLRTPKRVHFQTPKARTPHTLPRAHKIDTDKGRTRRDQCTPSRSPETVSNIRDRETSRRIGDFPTSRTHTREMKTSYSTEKGRQQIKSGHGNTSNGSHGKESSPKSSTYRQRCPQKQMIILKKGQDVSSLLAERENKENLRKEKDEQEGVEHQKVYTILRPDQSMIPEKDRKQMRSSVQISKSQNSIKPSTDITEEACETSENYKSRSTVSANDVQDNVDCSKQKFKGPKRRKRVNKTRNGPKTQKELFQRYIETGQLRSKFSRYKTEGLKELRLLEELHKGTFAVKYKARHQNKQVVLSVYFDQDVCDIDDVEMAHMGNCYFILGISDCIAGPNSSLWFMTIHHNLGDLQKLLSRDLERHVIGEKHVQFITAGVLFGVDFLHHRNIVHGNIKPSKVLINNLGFPVLTGFLKVKDDPNTDPRDVYTPAYAAPERYRGNRSTSVDIFSVGCLAYEIVTGSTPFDGGSLEETKANILKLDVRPLYEPELFSLAAEFFIDSCLCKSPKERFAMGEEKRNLLREEWFSTIDWWQFKRQTLKSPILEAIQLIDNHAILQWEEKTVQFPWGRVMDVACPDRPTLPGMEECLS